MKYTLFLFCLIVVLNCFSQGLSHFDEANTFNWEDNGFQSIDDTTLKSIFPIIINRPFRELSSAMNARANYHFVDLNLDGVDEIIYNGWTGGEGEMVLIIKRNSDQSYELSQTLFGKIVDLTIDDHQYQMVLLDYACCAGHVDHLIRLGLNRNSGQYEIIDDLAKVHGTYFNFSSFEPIRFEVEREIYHLRFSPKIEIELNPDDYPYELIQNQNIIAVYEKGSTGTAIGKKSDQTGRIWWLVIMDNIPSTEATLFYSGNNKNNDYRCVGWMSSRFLKVI